MQEQIIISFSPQKFEELLKRTISEVLAQKSNTSEKETSNISYLTRKQVSEILHISLTTLDTYTRLQLIPCYKIGKRVLYKSEDLSDSLLEKLSELKYKSK